MTTRAAFLASIIENPADDAPRLIYADWLEENGESERAEFIRVQCRFHYGEVPDCTYGCPRDDCFRCQLRRKERRLLKLAGGWADGLPAEFEMKNLVWRRGFVAEVTLTCADWLKHGPQLVRQCPLEKVTLSDQRPVFIRVGDGLFQFSWMEHHAEVAHHCPLPVSLFSFLRSGEFGSESVPLDRGLNRITTWHHFYPTVESAQDDLSHACLAWAKAQPASSAPGAPGSPELAAR